MKGRDEIVGGAEGLYLFARLAATRQNMCANYPPRHC